MKNKGNKAPIYILNYDHLVIKASTLTHKSRGGGETMTINLQRFSQIVTQLPTRELTKMTL